MPSLSRVAVCRYRPVVMLLVADQVPPTLGPGVGVCVCVCVGVYVSVEVGTVVAVGIGVRVDVRVGLIAARCSACAGAAVLTTSPMMSTPAIRV